MGNITKRVITRHSDAHPTDMNPAQGGGTVEQYEDYRPHKVIEVKEPARKPVRRRKPRKKDNKMLWIGLAACAVCSVLAGVVIIILACCMGGGSNQQQQNRGAQATGPYGNTTNQQQQGGM